MYISLTLLLQILTVDSLKEDQVITEEETLDLLESTRHALLGRAPWSFCHHVLNGFEVARESNPI